MILFSLCKLASNLPHLSSGLKHHLSWVRHELLPTDEERDATHLASAADLHELEFRIREVGRSNRQRRGAFRAFRSQCKQPTNNPDLHRQTWTSGSRSEWRT